MSLRDGYFFTGIGDNLEPGKGETFDAGCGAVWITQKVVS